MMTGGERALGLTAGTPSQVRAGAVAALIFVLLCPVRSGAQDVSQQSSVLTHDLMSPFCPGLLLADCKSDGARELRAEIAQRLAAGEAGPAIEADLIARFGPEIRTEPEFRGIGILAWLGPVLLGVGGFAVMTGALRRVTSSRDNDRSGREGPLDEDPVTRGRLDDELRDLD